MASRRMATPSTSIDTGAKAIARGLRRDLDLMILDLGLPDRDGLDVLKELRGARINVPVLVLTARDAVDSRVAALDAGADDYLVKPFAFAELVARIGALTRRAGGPRWAPSNDVPLVMRDDLVVEAEGKSVVALAARVRAARHARAPPRRGRHARRDPARGVRLRVRSRAPTSSTSTSRTCARSSPGSRSRSRPCAAPASGCTVLA